MLWSFIANAAKAASPRGHRAQIEQARSAAQTHTHPAPPAFPPHSPAHQRRRRGRQFRLPITSRALSSPRPPRLLVRPGASGPAPRPPPAVGAAGPAARRHPAPPPTPPRLLVRAGIARQQAQGSVRPGVSPRPRLSGRGCDRSRSLALPPQSEFAAVPGRPVLPPAVYE